MMCMINKSYDFSQFMKKKFDGALIENYFIKIIAYCKICLANFEDLSHHFEVSRN